MLMSFSDDVFCRVILRWFCRLNKENVYSRAYIAFKDEELLATFSREYDGHIFRDKAGTVHPTVNLGLRSSC